MRNALLSLATAILIIFSQYCFAQNVSGKIIRTAVNSTANGILDPISPTGYTSKTTAGFLGDDVGNAKLGFKPIPAFSNEPFGDLRRGASHLYSDFVPDVNGSGVYIYFDGTNLLFRMRLGTIIPGAKGYSILIDTDLKFGNSGPNADPNYLPATTGVNGNPGFEREIVLATGGTNNGILVYDIDGNDNPSGLTPIATYSGWTNYSQISIAGTNDNGDPDFFLDFYIPLSALGGSITSSTPLRFNATTVMSGQAAVGGPKSDIYGVNDNSYKSTNAEWEAYINQQPPITPSSLSGTGTLPTSTTACSAAPTITSVTTTGGANGKGQVTGSWTKFSTSPFSTATITVSRNGAALTGTVTASSGSTWTYDIPSAITVSSGETITAQAQASGESMCLTSNNFVVSACSYSTWVASGLVAPISTSAGNDYACFTSTNNTTNKGVGATNRTSAAWTVYVNEAVANTTKNSVANQGSADFTNNGSTTTFTSTYTADWMYSKGCQTGSPMSAGTYAFWYQDANGCKSEITTVCSGMTSRVVMTPSVSPSIVTQSTSSVTVTGAAGSSISLYYNGEVVATGTIPGTFNNTTTGTITFSGLSFGTNGAVSAVAKYIVPGNTTTSYCMTKSNTQIVALCTTTAPVINADNNSQITAGQAITGYSSEPSGTTIKVYTSTNTAVATVTTLSDGSWTTNGVYNAISGTIYYATAQNSSCSVSAASVNVTAANATTNVCGTITSSVNEASTAVSGNLSATPASSTTINLYQDGVFVATTSTSTSTWTISGITAGTFNPNSSLTIGIRQGTNQEVICSNTKTVACSTLPTAPTIVSPTNPAITPNSTVTYTLSGITSDNFYGIVDINSGKSLATGAWAASNSNLNITTYPFSGTSGTVYNIQIKVSSINGSSTAVCTNFATGNVTITGTLPVSFLSLSANKVPTGVQVNWSVTNEQNVAYYVVERSSDCLHYDAAGQVGFNNSSAAIKQYLFVDPMIFSGIVCYRIKQVDADGRAHYSNIVSLKANNSFSVQVAPNPANEKASIYLTTSKADNVLMQLVDLNGKILSAKSIAVREGSNVLPLDNLSILPRGSYLVKISTREGVYYQKLMLQ